MYLSDSHLHQPIQVPDMKEFGSEKTLEDLGVGDGTLTVTANGKTFTVDAKKEDSIKDFIQKFNDAAAAATGPSSLNSFLLPVPVELIKNLWFCSSNDALTPPSDNNHC